MLPEATGRPRSSTPSLRPMQPGTQALGLILRASFLDQAGLMATVRSGRVAELMTRGRGSDSCDRWFVSAHEVSIRLASPSELAWRTGDLGVYSVCSYTSAPCSEGKSRGGTSERPHGIFPGGA